MKCLRITGTMHVFEDFPCDRSSDFNLSFGCNPESSDFCNNKKMTRKPTAKKILSEFSGPDNISNRICM